MLAFFKRLFGRKHAERAPAKPRASRRSATSNVLAKPEPKAPAHGAAKKPGPAADAERDSEFDPYNTGKFDRAASWERVRHSQR